MGDLRRLWVLAAGLLAATVVSGVAVSTNSSDQRPAGAGVTRVHALPWSLIGVAEDGRLLRIRIEHGMCTTVERIEIDETAGSVRLDVVGRTLVAPPPREDGLEFACPGARALRVEEVELDAPLGDREVTRN